MASKDYACGCMSSKAGNGDYISVTTAMACPDKGLHFIGIVKTATKITAGGVYCTCIADCVYINHVRVRFSQESKIVQWSKL